MRLGIEPDTRLLTEAAAWQYAADAVARYDGDMDEVPNAESTVIGAVVDLAGELAEHLLEVDDLRAEIDRLVAAIDATPPTRPGAALPGDVIKLRATLRARRAVLPIVSRFQHLKRSRDAMDFADQVAFAARLATEIPEVGRIERRRFHAVLLDEFQDTSEAQLALLRGLFVAPGEPVRVTAVGDPHQAIYGWRGASATTLSRFPSEFADGAPAQVANLATTWRNDVHILNAANLVSRELRKAATVQVSSLRPRPAAPYGAIVAGRYETQADEAAAVAQWLAQVRSPEGTTAAVLCRKRSQFAPIMAALEAHGIPFEVVGLGGLLLTPEVSDLVAVLRILSDPTRGDAVMRLVTGASCRLGAADLDGLHEWARQRQQALSIRDRAVLAAAHRGPDAEAPLRDLAHDAADALSLAEALDDLPPPQWVGGSGQRISGAALVRLDRLASSLRALRSLRGMALVDMVGEAERALGLDIEVLARPDYTPSAARAHLDAFADVAASFSATADHPTLSAFLAWLDAALEQERGLDLGHLEPARDAVQILTVHAAKGLEWDVVAIPGLVEGTFPASASAKMSHVVKPSAGAEAPLDDQELAPDPEYRWAVHPPKASGWLTGLKGVPYALRGDADGLPRLQTTGLNGKELDSEIGGFKLREGDRELTEERRLAYVAVTRARSALLLTSHVWGTQVTPRVTSVFLREILAAATDLGVELRSWAPMPDPDAAPPVPNPTVGQTSAILWPVDPFALRREALERADAAFEQARATRIEGERDAPALPLGAALLPAGFASVKGRHADADEVDVALLIAERRAAAEPRQLAVVLPGHVTASDVVRLAQDPADFARELRRPMPQPPALAARRGTEFHAWVEQHYAKAALLDVVELPGAADETADPEGAVPLAHLQERFLASEWAERVPRHLEYAVETVVAGVAVRGRIDAVFDRHDGGVTVVDWKTGPRPHDDAARFRVLQLAAYALAFARLTGRDPTSVDAAFYYAQTGETVYPDVPDEQTLRRLLGSIPVAE
ncbi:MAG: ATP-dependent DNA helicase [Dermatophilaceae bacterium]